MASAEVETLAHLLEIYREKITQPKIAANLTELVSVDCSAHTDACLPEQKMSVQFGKFD